jgi:hypothetical protein
VMPEVVVKPRSVRVGEQSGFPWSSPRPIIVLCTRTLGDSFSHQDRDSLYDDHSSKFMSVVRI